jgi:hypothetical protein
VGKEHDEKKGRSKERKNWDRRKGSKQLTMKEVVVVVAVVVVVVVQWTKNNSEVG